MNKYIENRDGELYWHFNRSHLDDEEFLNIWKSHYPNFATDLPKIMCPEAGYVLILNVFMDRLQAFRGIIDAPLYITSFYRSPSYNAKISSTGSSGPHTTGAAADIHCYGEIAHRLCELAFFEGMGVGVKQRGPHSGRFIHLDMCNNSARCPRPWIWSYP